MFASVSIELAVVYAEAEATAGFACKENGGGVRGVGGNDEPAGKKGV
jgi:hypothetical protein